MDYRLVKQYLNSAVDNFFNFFYKMGDFAKVLGDAFWAFLEIWYNFFMFFVNLALYVYYLFLYVLDKMTLSSAPIFFWRKSGAQTRQDFGKAYQKGTVNPVSGMYGRTPKATAVNSPLSGAVGSVSKAASSVASTVSRVQDNVQSSASVVAAGRVSRKPNFVARFFAAIGRGIVAFFSAIFRLFSNFWKFIISKLMPVKEAPVGRKDLMNDYMKQYEKSKRA